MSPYEVLGISSNSSIDEIKSAYRKLAKLYHPDSQSGTADPIKFREVTEAYRFIISGKGNTSDLVGLDIFEDCYISVKDSIFGFKKFYQISKSQRCECGAFGVKCLKCHGSKYIKKGLTLKTKCPRCNGTGYENNGCYKCKGSGIKNTVESIDISSNVRTNNGEIRIFNYSQGKLNIKFLIKKSDTDIYDRTGNDLIYIAKISPLDQILGTTLIIPRINKDSIKLQIKENICIPSYFKIENSGVPETNGNLIIQVIVDNKLMNLNLIPIIKEAIQRESC